MSHKQVFCSNRLISWSISASDHFLVFPRPLVFLFVNGVSCVNSSFSSDAMLSSDRPRDCLCVFMFWLKSPWILSRSTHACAQHCCVFCANVPDNVGPNKGNVGGLFWSSFNIHPTTSNNVQQVPTTLNRVSKRAKHVHWTMLGACSVNMFSAFARSLYEIALFNDKTI